MDQLAKCCKIVKAGGIVAYPTEAVWGLGCDPWNAQAVTQLLQLKQRSQSKGLIIVASNIQQLDNLLSSLSPENYKKLNSASPSDTTWLVPNNDLTPKWVTGKHQSVAVRISKHPDIHTLCTKTGPLISTSANPNSLPPATNLTQVQTYFPTGIDAFYAGSLGSRNTPTPIVDLLTGIRFR